MTTSARRTDCKEARTSTGSGVQIREVDPAAPRRWAARLQLESLEAVLAASPMLGVRRLTLLVLQLAIELDLAVHGEIMPGALCPASIFIENPATPRERARLPIALEQVEVPTRRAGMAELGRLIQGLLAQKPLYLEESVWVPRAGTRILRRRADAEVLHAIGRALSLIAQRCVGGLRAYESTIEPVRDLTRLTELTTRIIARRRAQPPIVGIHQPRAAMRAGVPLPKVVVQSSACSTACVAEGSVPVAVGLRGALRRAW